MWERRPEGSGSDVGRIYENRVEVENVGMRV